MKAPYVSNKISFDHLNNFFQKKSENLLVLESHKGEGYVQLFDLEKGLQARFWDCRFKDGIEMLSSKDSGVGNSYFNLAFFLNTHGIQFANRDASF